MLDKLNAVEARYGELATLLADPAVQSDATKYRDTAKALSEIEPLVEKYREFKGVDQQLRDAQAYEAATRWVDRHPPLA